MGKRLFCKLGKGRRWGCPGSQNRVQEKNPDHRLPSSVNFATFKSDYHKLVPQGLNSLHPSSGRIRSPAKAPMRMRIACSPSKHFLSTNRGAQILRLKKNPLSLDINVINTQSLAVLESVVCWAAVKGKEGKRSKKCYGLELQLPADPALSGSLVGGPKALKRRELVGQVSAELRSWLDRYPSRSRRPRGTESI